MARAFTPKVVTANDLLEGDVIYMTKNGSWTRNHGDAFLIETPDEADRHLKLAQTQQETMVGAYLADAERDADGKAKPVHFREVFRTKGPSNYFHGKQAVA